MNQEAFESYVLKLLFAALEPFVGDRPGWTTTPLSSLLSEDSLTLFYQLADDLFAKLLTLNAPALSGAATDRPLAGMAAHNGELDTPQSLASRLSAVILASAAGGRQRQQQQQQQQEEPTFIGLRRSDPAEAALLARAENLPVFANAGPVLKMTSHIPASASADEERGNWTAVQIFYATDREPAKDKRLGLSFSAKRAKNESLHYGECVVSIPDTHKLGEFESPSFLRLEFRPNPSKHIVLQEVTSLEEGAFYEKVRQRVAGSAAQDAFIFVHGYNVDFKSAARRTGQFAFDLGFVGAPILYSWPSNGTVGDYASDSANVIWTASHLERMLRLLEARSGARKIHLIAHSMGNRAVCDALKALSYSQSERAQALLHHLVLAAPDIDAETFRQLASALRQVSDRITLYASGKDKALAASAKLHKYPRAGGVPVMVLSEVESIDASAVGTDFLAHSYFASTYPLLADIYELLSDDKPASMRFALRAITGVTGVYYRFKA